MGVHHARAKHITTSANLVDSLALPTGFLLLTKALRLTHP